MPTPPRVVHEFEAGRGTIRTTLTTPGGREFIDVRMWVEPRGELGAELIPTKRGLSVALDFLPELTEAVEAIGETVKRERGEAG